MSNSAQVIAIDVGGTDIKAGLVSGEKILEELRLPTERELGSARIVSKVVSLAKQMHESFPQAQAIGLVVPGVVDSTLGIGLFSENLNWKDVDFKFQIEQVTSIPVRFGHDVRAGGLAEAKFGASRGFKNSFFMPIGTGIAGAIIVEGELYDNPFSGEIGHLNVDSHLLCACGLVGCLESIATAPAMIKLYLEKTGVSFTRSKEILDLAKNGDDHAIEIWQTAMAAIGRAVVAYISILAPEIIIFGGGVSNAGDDFIKPIQNYINNNLTFQRKPILKVAELGDRAGLIGAGILATKALL
jgi:glucokinase